MVPGHGSGGGRKGDPLVIVADTRRLTGWQAWWANLYNESHAYFTAVTVITIPVVGLILGTNRGFRDETDWNRLDLQGIVGTLEPFGSNFGSLNPEYNIVSNDHKFILGGYHMDWLYVLMPISGVDHILAGSWSSWDWESE